MQALSGALVYIITFSSIDFVAGWSYADWVLVLGIVISSRGLWNIFFSGILDLPQLVRTGQYDNIINMPVPSLVILSSSKINSELWGEFFIGVFLICLSLVKGYAVSNILFLLVLFISVVMGTLIYFSFYIIVMSVSFWQFNSLGLLIIFERLDELSKVPLNIFPSWVRGILLTIIPVGLIGYIPGAYLSGKVNIYLYLSSVLASILFFSFSVFFL
ncbi:ABC-2 family transporter protein [Rothia sp. CCM 9419]|uniref:ABC-2 family transporter protein n=1 Tax=Rothia sp. CCM 9419 TaxID=3402662 RepID=UPI003AE51E9F